MSHISYDPFGTTPLWQNGPIPGRFHDFPGRSSQSQVTNFSGVFDYAKRSQAPITTSTSVLGIKFDKGVLIAGDMLGSYGSLARFRNCPRVMKVNENIILGASGDYADFQYLKDIIEQKIIDEKCLGDGHSLKPKSLHCWLTRVLYNKRSRMDPLWNNYVVGGIQDGVPFLGSVDKLGTAYEDSVIATGVGALIATPLLREELDKGPLDEAAARQLIVKCLEVLFYRDARSSSRYEIAVATADGIVVDEPAELKHDWSLVDIVKGYED